MEHEEFKNPLDSFERWKHTQDPNRIAEFERTHFMFVLRWKQTEQMLLPRLLHYSKQYYPDIHEVPELREAIRQEHIINIFQLCEDIWRTVRNCEEGRTVLDVYGDHYRIVKTIPYQFWMEDERERMHHPNKEWLENPKFHSLIEELKQETMARIEKWVPIKRQYVDMVQTVLLETFPMIMQLEGEWWKVYEMNIACSYNWYAEEFNRLQFKHQHPEKFAA